MRCHQEEDNTGARCTRESRANVGERSGGSSHTAIRSSSILKSIVKHIEQEKNAPERCTPVASDGGEGVVFYFEQFLPHLQYAGLPLKIISPVPAVAQSGVDAAPSDAGTSTAEPSVPDSPSSSSSVEDAICKCPSGSTHRRIDFGVEMCYVMSKNGQCPSGWRGPAETGVCSARCGADLIALQWPEPEPEEVVEEEECSRTNCVGNDRECRDKKCVCTGDKELVGDQCLDQCSNPTPRRQGTQCVCEESSCGAGKVCNNGQCENASAATPDPTPAGPFNWCENCDCRYKRYFEDEGDIDIEGLCEDPILLSTDADGEVEEQANQDCSDYLQYIVENIKEKNELIKEQNHLKRQKRDEERTARRNARRCDRNPDLEICRQRHPGMTEAGAFCTSCFQEVIDAAYPKNQDGRNFYLLLFLWRELAWLITALKKLISLDPIRGFLWIIRPCTVWLIPLLPVCFTEEL